MRQLGICLWPTSYNARRQWRSLHREVFQDVCLIMGVKNLYTTAYHPRTNGQTERFNWTIVSSLRHYVNSDQNDWDDCITLLTYSYNT